MFSSPIPFLLKLTRFLPCDPWGVPRNERGFWCLMKVFPWPNISLERWGVQNDNGPLGCEMDLCFRIIVTVQKPTFRGYFTHLKNVVLGLVVIITSFMSPTWTFIFRGYNYPPLRILGMSGLGCQVSHLF